MDVRLEKSYSYHICEIYSDNVIVCLYIKFSFYLCSFNRECMEHNVMKSFRIFLCYFQTEWSVFFTLQCDLFTSCNVSNNAYMDDPFLQKQLFVGVFQSRFSKKFTIFTEKHLCRSLFFIKWQVWRPTTLAKSDSYTGFFPCEYCKSSFYRTPLMAASVSF